MLGPDLVVDDDEVDHAAPDLKNGTRARPGHRRSAASGWLRWPSTRHAHAHYCVATETEGPLAGALMTLYSVGANPLIVHKTARGVPQGRGDRQKAHQGRQAEQP